MSPRRFLAPFVACALALGLAACGGDDDTDNTEVDETTETTAGSDGSAEATSDTATESSDATETTEASVDEGDVATTDPGGAAPELAGTPFCEGLEDISAFAADVGADLPDDASFEDEKELFLDGFRGMEERFGDLDDVPSEIEADLDTFTGFLSDTIEAFESVNTEEEAQAVLAEVPPELVESQQRLGAFAADSCGVALF